MVSSFWAFIAPHSASPKPQCTSKRTSLGLLFLMAKESRRSPKEDAVNKICMVDLVFALSFAAEGIYAASWLGVNGHSFGAWVLFGAGLVLSALFLAFFALDLENYRSREKPTHQTRCPS